MMCYSWELWKFRGPLLVLCSLIIALCSVYPSFLTVRVPSVATDDVTRAAYVNGDKDDVTDAEKVNGTTEANRDVTYHTGPNDVKVKDDVTTEEKDQPHAGEEPQVRAYSPDLIDLDPEELFNRTVIITGFSQDHFIEAKGMIHSVQEYLPHTQIIAYDLGLKQQAIQEVERMCNVKLRKFHTAKYPPHFADLKKYAFKALIIAETLKEFGVIFWCDASARFKQDPRVMYPYLKEQHGLFIHILRYDPKLFIERTHPLMFKELGVDRNTYSKDRGHAPTFESGRILFVNSTLLRRKLIDPWVACSLRHQCIAPENSTLPLNMHGPKYTHRYDQAALSLLAYKNMYDGWTRKNDRQKLFVDVVGVDRHDYAGSVKFCS